MAQVEEAGIPIEFIYLPVVGLCAVILVAITCACRHRRSLCNNSRSAPKTDKHKQGIGEGRSSPEQRKTKRRCRCCCCASWISGKKQTPPISTRQLCAAKTSSGTDVAKRQVLACPDQWAGSVLLTQPVASSGSTHFPSSQGNGIPRDLEAQFEEAKMGLQEDRGGHDACATSYDSPRALHVEAIAIASKPARKDLGGGIRAFLEMVTPDKAAMCNFGDVCDGDFGMDKLRIHLSPLESQHETQFVAVSEEENTFGEPPHATRPLCIQRAPAQSPPRRFFPWRQGSPKLNKSSANSCNNSNVVGIAISDACTNHDDMVLKLADRIAQLESQLHQQNANSMDPGALGVATAAANKDQTELACAENGAIVDRPTHEHEEPCSIDGTREPSCSTLATNHSLFDQSIPMQAGSISTDVAALNLSGGWYDRIRSMQLWLPQHSGHPWHRGARQACDSQKDNVAITCHSEEVGTSIASDPALFPAVVAAMDQLNQRVAELEEQRNTDEFSSNDDPAVAETLRTLARRVMDLEHRRMTGGPSPGTTPLRVMPPELQELEVYVAPLDMRNATSNCSDGSSDFADLRLSAPMNAKEPMPVELDLLPTASSPPSTMVHEESLAQSAQVAHSGYLCEGAASVSRPQSSSSKWADPSLGVVSSEASEAHAPRVPRGRFGIRPLRKCVGSGSGGRLGGSPARRSSKTTSPAKMARRE